MLENKQTQDSYFSFKLSSVMFSLPVKYVREVFEFEKSKVENKTIHQK